MAMAAIVVRSGSRIGVLASDRSTMTANTNVHAGSW